MKNKIPVLIPLIGFNMFIIFQNLRFLTNFENVDLWKIIASALSFIIVVPFSIFVFTQLSRNNNV